MKILILAALGLLILTLACAVEGQVSIPAQNGAAAVETPTPEPTAVKLGTAGISPVEVRDAWREGREKDFPPGDRVLFALPQTAFEDTGCHLFIWGSPACGISYPDPESRHWHREGVPWDAFFAFPDVELAKAFRESLGLGPVTVSCTIPEDWDVIYQATAFQNCEER